MPPQAAQDAMASLWVALALAALALTVVAVLATVLGVYAVNRSRSLGDLATRLALTPLATQGAAAEGLLADMAEFELPHNAAWSIERGWEGRARPPGPTSLRLLEMRGDPFGRYARGELPLTVVFLRRPGVRLPKFLVMPRAAWIKRLGPMGQGDLDFEDPFSRANRLIGADREGLRRLFTLPVRDLLRDHRRLTIEGCGDGLLLYRFPQRLDGRDVEEVLRRGLDLLDHLAPAALEGAVDVVQA